MAAVAMFVDVQLIGQVKKGRDWAEERGPPGRRRAVGRNNEGKIAVATEWWMTALVKLRAPSLAPSVRGTKRMNNNQLVRDARIQSQGMAVDSLSFLPSLSPHLRSPFRVAEVKEERELGATDCEGGREGRGSSKTTRWQLPKSDGRTDGARTVRTVLLVGMRTNGAAAPLAQAREGRGRNAILINQMPLHRTLGWTRERFAGCVANHERRKKNEKTIEQRPFAERFP